MYTINKLNENHKPIPLKHKCEEEFFGQPMTDEILHDFAVSLILVYYYYQGGEIISKNPNIGLEFPHLVMKNDKLKKNYFVIIQGAPYPQVPEPLPADNYANIIMLSKDANAVPVFVGVTFMNMSREDPGTLICGDKYIVQFTGLLPLND